MAWYDEQGDGSGVKDHHLDFFKRQVGSFLNAGGTLHLRIPDHTNIGFHIDANDKHSNRVASMELMDQADGIHIEYLSSGGHIPGSATAIEYAVAHMAHKNNQYVESAATPQAINYHLKIGRNFYEFFDQDPNARHHIDYNPSSWWTDEDCHKIANLNLLPESMSKQFDHIPKDRR